MKYSIRLSILLSLVVYQLVVKPSCGSSQQVVPYDIMSTLNGSMQAIEDLSLRDKILFTYVGLNAAGFMWKLGDRMINNRIEIPVIEEPIGALQWCFQKVTYLGDVAFKEVERLFFVQCDHKNEEEYVRKKYFNCADESYKTKHNNLVDQESKIEALLPVVGEVLGFEKMGPEKREEALQLLSKENNKELRFLPYEKNNNKSCFEKSCAVCSRTIFINCDHANRVMESKNLNKYRLLKKKKFVLSSIVAIEYLYDLPPSKARLALDINNENAPNLLNQIIWLKKKGESSVADFCSDNHKKDLKDIYNLIYNFAYDGGYTDKYIKFCNISIKNDKENKMLIEQSINYAVHIDYVKKAYRNWLLEEIRKTFIEEEEQEILNLDNKCNNIGNNNYRIKMINSNYKILNIVKKAENLLAKLNYVGSCSIISDTCLEVENCDPEILSIYTAETLCNFLKEEQMRPYLEEIKECCDNIASLSVEEINATLQEIE
ncbi:MAG: hypothetical protein WBQ73_03695, partial [Candidatus Babeliales bacterium]